MTSAPKLVEVTIRFIHDNLQVNDQLLPRISCVGQRIC